MNKLAQLNSKFLLIAFIILLATFAICLRWSFILDQETSKIINKHNESIKQLLINFEMNVKNSSVTESQSKGLVTIINDLIKSDRFSSLAVNQKPLFSYIDSIGWRNIDPSLNHYQLVSYAIGQFYNMNENWCEDSVSTSMTLAIKEVKAVKDSIYLRIKPLYLSTNLDSIVIYKAVSKPDNPLCLIGDTSVDPKDMKVYTCGKFYKSKDK